MGKEDVYTYRDRDDRDREVVEYYSATRKQEILPFATVWMKLEDIMFSEIRQAKTNTGCL